MADLPFISTLQRFSLDDGPGIRTTVFFKGCNLRCAWCHNPECILPGATLQFLEGSCTGCGKCAAVCPQGVHTITPEGRHLLDRSRVYFRLLRQIVRQGCERGEFRPDMTTDEIVKAFAMWERAQLYDWCLCGGDYSLVTYADKMTPLFLESFRAES